MRNDLVWMGLAILAFVALFIYWDHIQVKKMFAEAGKRINNIYDSAKAFLFVHFVEQASTDSNDIDENIN